MTPHRSAFLHPAAPESHGPRLRGLVDRISKNYLRRFGESLWHLAIYPWTVLAQRPSVIQIQASDFQAFWEAVIGGLLVASAIFLHATNWELVREIDLFALALAVQSLPFLASVALAVLEGSRLNNFAFWHGLEARLGQMLTRRPAATTTPAPMVAAVPTDKHVEPAQ